jgi:amino acid adenylation domain-containing protein
MNLAKAQDIRAEIEKQKAYWQTRLGGQLPVMQVYPDYPRPPVSSFIRARESVDLDPQLCRQIRDLCTQENVTLFVMLLAAFKTLLLRHTGQEDIIVGSPSSDSIRWTEGESQQRFTNLLALRTSLAGDSIFVGLLHRVAKTVEDAAVNRDYPFEKLVEDIHGHNDVSVAPIFQAMFALCNAPFTLSLDPITEYHLVNIEDQSNRRDVVFLVCSKDEILKVTCEYDADLFESATITRQFGHFQTLLKGIVANPKQRISELPILTDAETHRLLVEWNDTARDYPKDKCIHELFEAQVERSPDAVAVVFEKQKLTYRELNQRANQLARYLKKLGVGPEVLVAICVERSLETIVGLLGILKAGGAYVPLEPEYPKHRLAFMLEDTQAPVLLTRARVIESLPDQGVTVVCFDKDWQEIASQRTENPDSESTSEDLAYVIYTSGSTGQPKGAAVPHRAIVRLLFGASYARFDADQTFLQLAPFSFDASTFEIWGALLHGAKCVLFPGTVPSLIELRDVLHKHRISTLWLTASLFNTVLDEAPEVLSAIRQLLIGGEALSIPHVRRALTELPQTEIINGYGPTESTTFACCYWIPRHLDELIHSIPVGCPIANTEVYLLDEQRSLVPIGVPAQLYIGGDGLARGYLNRPELTAEKFIPNPFSDKPGSRLYRTGDLGRYLPDGTIEFLGRTDHQVKIRGFRVELGEIEAVLSQHQGVKEVAVVAREDTPEDKRLVAYVGPSQNSCPTPYELRSFLKQKLPEQMVPSAFVILDALPLTPNGKINRKALPAPDQNRPEFEQSFVVPRTPVEKLLAEIWAEVLKVERVGIHDNFFDLGGHSVLATQVVSRLREAFHVDVLLRALFEAPTIAELALRIEPSTSEGSELEDLARNLAEVESLSEEEIERQLAKEDKHKKQKATMG